MGLFNRLTAGLSKTRENLLGTIKRLLPGNRKITPELYEELEAALLAADIGTAATAALMQVIQETVRQTGEADEATVRRRLKATVVDRLRKVVGVSQLVPEASPSVILMAGINGVGKTTTLGKLAHYFSQKGKKVVLVAADTFRAAAAEQLVLWGERVGVDVIRHQAGADPAAVAFDGVAAGQARHADVVLVDTAGRLHTKSNLMDELRKIKRTLGKAMSGSPHEVWLVLDATVGQNGLAQAKQFHEVLGLTGVILTKLDGTAKGGIVVAISDLGVPIRFVGTGEGLDDLQEFDPEAFADGLFGEE